MNWSYIILCGTIIIVIVLLMDITFKMSSAISDYNYEFCIVNNSGSFAFECFDCGVHSCLLPNGSVIEIPTLSALNKLEGLKT